MGLDMFLYKTKKGCSLETGEEIAYWRKANQIHNWFVQNVQKGTDICDYHKVSKGVLNELLDTCKAVVEKAILSSECEDDFASILNKEEIAELLPTKSGFFFGSIDYDKWYLEDVKHTINMIETILEEVNFDEEEVYYHSWW